MTTTTAVAEIIESPAGRRALAVQSPVFFDSYYCGMRFAAHRERWLGMIEKSRTSSLGRSQKGAFLLLAPRDHGKTEACISVTVRAICMDRNTRILWISESQGQAEKRMRRAKTVLESERITTDWCSNPELGMGAWRQTPEDRWMATQVYVSRGLHSVDPTLEAVGAGGSVTGGHFDMIICDDLEDDRTTFSAAQRQKTREWFRGTVRPMLVKGGMLLVVGTRKHHDDLYGHFVDDPTFRIWEDKAITRFPESHKFIYEKDDNGRETIIDVKVEGESEVLWPEERPIDYLLRERMATGNRLFNREFQNEIVDDESAAVRWDWLQAAMGRGAALSLYELPDEQTAPGLDIVQGWDFALVTDVHKAETRDTDYSVGITWGRDDNGVRYLLGIRRVRGLSQSRLHLVVKEEYEKFGRRIRVVSVERNNFGELHYLGLKRSTDLPLKPHLTTGKAKADPWEGVPSISMLFEAGKVVLPSQKKDDREALEPLVHRVSFGDGNEMAMAAEERKAGPDLLDGDDDDRGLQVFTEAPAEETPKDRRARESAALASRSWRGLPGYDAQ